MCWSKGRGGRRDFEDRGVSAVSDTRQQDTIARFAATGSTAVSIRPTCAAPVCPTVKANASAIFAGSILAARANSSTARGLGASRITRGDVVGFCASLFEDRRDGLLQQRRVSLSQGKAFFP